MKKRTFYILFLALLQSYLSFAQQDSITLLEEVILSDVHLYHSSRENRLQILTDSVLQRNAYSLTETLEFTTPLYFKTNGPGMVSSVSFRGTMPSQTAVVWNGININSQLNGQVDFNSLLTAGYDRIILKPGGGSVLYGSGAIGGSVHLQNSFRFGRGVEHKLQLGYGSFNTVSGMYSGHYSDRNTSFEVGLQRYSSDNDFAYPDSNRRNENGDFRNTSINVNFAQHFKYGQELKFYSELFFGTRGFSGSLVVSSNSKYQDLNSRNLLEWKGQFKKFTSILKLAYLDEEYKYYENRTSKEHVFGQAKTGNVKHELEYPLEEGMKLSSLLEVRHTAGTGSNIGEAYRTTGSVGLLFSHELSRLSYELSGRKEVSDVYSAPLLFSLNVDYQVSPFYSLNLNLSRNYRVPTFNDLFWYAGGNQELRPERALQGELGQQWRMKGLRLNVNAFLIRTDDLLRWVPGANGIWAPENTKAVRNYGLEGILHWKKKFGVHHTQFSGSYAYTRSEDLSLEKELVFVPRHKATASAAYTYHWLSCYYQWLYTGEVFTSSDNRNTLESYTLSNLGIAVDFLKNIPAQIGLEVHNLWDTEYQSVPTRPMPGRSIHTKLTFKF